MNFNFVKLTFHTSHYAHNHLPSEVYPRWHGKTIGCTHKPSHTRMAELSYLSNLALKLNEAARICWAFETRNSLGAHFTFGKECSQRLETHPAIQGHVEFLRSLPNCACLGIIIVTFNFYCPSGGQGRSGAEGTGTLEGGKTGKKEPAGVWQTPNQPSLTTRFSSSLLVFQDSLPCPSWPSLSQQTPASP